MFLPLAPLLKQAIYILVYQFSPFVVRTAPTTTSRSFNWAHATLIHRKLHRTLLFLA